ncbi:hypothetical protein [Hymenobacter rubripertinctus]|uniref:Lipocalin-like domain-containing protein n=1 Tax=Hymenobacter rubripertinctus TaxID=2029981 RepID=A0A418QQ53_9BACT|nr:hypothetical protein [Hymenobacter rubripertinctus]RIY07218.1 hypothetical protein D0T11_16890 [Hymenobacter rubripertinctus]
MKARTFLLPLGGALVLTSLTATRPDASFFATYTYVSYAILDQASSPVPLPAQGVGGTLALQANGTYQKRLTLSGNGGTMRFDQDGRFTFTPGRIRFTYTDKNGRSRTDEGTFRLTKSQLTIMLAGFPAGNQSMYTLRR